jgi:hypothetical protein
LTPGWVGAKIRRVRPSGLPGPFFTAGPHALEAFLMHIVITRFTRWLVPAVSIQRFYWFVNLIMTDIMATESTEKHGNNQAHSNFPCSSVDSVAIKNTGTQLDLSASGIIELKAYLA